MRTIEALKAQGKVALWLDWRAGVETDQSGNNISVSYSGAIKPTKTPYGNGIYCTSGTLIRAAASPATALQNLTVMILGDLRPQTPISKLISVSGQYELYWQNGQMVVSVGGGATAVTVPSSAASMYTAKINNTTNASLYRNGTYISNPAVSTLTGAQTAVDIGSGSASNGAENTITQAIIFNVLLTDQEITDIYNEYLQNRSIDTGTTTYQYPKPYLADKTNVLFETGFEIRQDGRINDVSNNGRHGTYAGPIKHVTGLLGNESANVFDVNGSISIGVVTATSQDLIFEWIGRHPTATTNFEYVFYTANRIVCHGSSTAQLAWYESSTFRNFGAAPVDNNLHHYILTLTATDGKARLYLDGVQLGADQTYTPFTLNEAMWLKDNNLAGGDYQGLLTYARISQGTMTTSEIQARANLVRYLATAAEDMTKLPATNTLTSGSISDYIIGSGTWKLNTLGQLENSAVGWVSKPNQFNGGTIVFEFNKTADGNDSTISYVASETGGYGAGRGVGYVLQFSANEGIALYTYSGATPTLVVSTGFGVFANNTTYKIAVRYQPAGMTTVYIKGGAYTTWTEILAPISTPTAFNSGFLAVNCALAGGFNFRHLYTFNGLLSNLDLNTLNI